MFCCYGIAMDGKSQSLCPKHLSGVRSLWCYKGFHQSWAVRCVKTGSDIIGDEKNAPIILFGYLKGHG